MDEVLSMENQGLGSHFFGAADDGWSPPIDMYSKVMYI